jgi:hypothetical protein
MARRKRVADAIQAEVLVKSRRRCCVCYGLKRDLKIKQGQIAHLDQNSANNIESNLAFLCFDHHDQFDSTTSQSKNLTAKEVITYKRELYRHFSPWGIDQSEHLLNYLAASIDAKAMAETLWKVGRRITAFPDYPIMLALKEQELELMDGETAMFVAYVLDNTASWGLVTYDFEQPGADDMYWKFRIDHRHPEMMKDLVEAIAEIARRPWE